MMLQGLIQAVQKSGVSLIAIISDLADAQGLRGEEFAKAAKMSGLPTFRTSGDVNYIDSDILVDLKIAPWSRAFQFGSGIHAGGDTYPIKPKNAKHLVFDWRYPSDPENAGMKFGGKLHKFFLSGDVATWFFNYVDHPGVYKPFIKEGGDVVYSPLIPPLVEAMTLAVREDSIDRIMNFVKHKQGGLEFRYNFNITYHVRFFGDPTEADNARRN